MNFIKHIGALSIADMLDHNTTLKTMSLSGKVSFISYNLHINQLINDSTPMRNRRNQSNTRR
jgi:hypothetical protein